MGDEGRKRASLKDMLPVFGVGLFFLLLGGLALNTMLTLKAEKATIERLAELDTRAPATRNDGQPHESSATCSDRCMAYTLQVDGEKVRCVTVRTSKAELWIDPEDPTTCAPADYDYPRAYLLITLALGVWAAMAVLINLALWGGFLTGKLRFKDNPIRVDD